MLAGRIRHAVVAALATGMTSAHTRRIKQATKSRTFGSATYVALSFPVKCKLRAMLASADPCKIRAGNAAALLLVELVAAPVMIHDTAVSVAATGHTTATLLIMCLER